MAEPETSVRRRARQAVLATCLLARALFPELLQVTGDQGARNVIRAHAAEVAAVPIPGTTPTDDLDTEEDYQRLLARYAALHAR